MNLLTEPVFRVETPDGQERLSLPQLLEALGLDRVESLPGLQRHQEDAFHIFLCYLAGAMLARESQTNPCQNAKFWLEGIRRLTGREDDCAWTLVVEDVTQPAFMQAPVPNNEDYDDYLTGKPKATSPDFLDLLVTSKNHDIKSAKISPIDMEAWVFALINLQTMTCYLGSGQNGIARSSGGTGCRPRVSLEVSLRLGIEWVTETRKLLQYRLKILTGPWKYSDKGIVFTWVPIWDWLASIPLTELDPFFIEISRAIRLVKLKQGIAAFGASTKPRVLVKSVRDQIKGKLGDPWIPIDTEKESALNVQKEGFTPKKLRDLIFLQNGDETVYESAFMQNDNSNDTGSCYFYASALARRGKDSSTEGYHIGRVYVPDKTRPKLFRRGTDHDRLATLSKSALNDAGQMQNRVLKVALFSFMEGGQNTDNIDWEKREVKEWWKTAENQFSEAWSSDYFPWLWRTAGQEDADAARLEWLKTLRDKAKVVLDDAIARYPARSGRRYRSRVKAEGMFAGCLNKTFPELKETRHESNRSD